MVVNSMLHGKQKLGTDLITSLSLYSDGYLKRTHGLLLSLSSSISKKQSNRFVDSLKR